MEFALVLPVLVLIMVGVMQFGILFWAQITLTQVSRDTGRWVASQGWECYPALDATADDQIIAQANAVAARSTLFAWSASNQLVLSAGPTYTDNPVGSGSKCPALTNQEIWDVSFELSHTVPVFMPMLADNGCSGGCARTLTSEVQFRVEPRP